VTRDAHGRLHAGDSPPLPARDGVNGGVSSPGPRLLAMAWGRVRRLPRTSADLCASPRIVFVFHGERLLPRRRAGCYPHHADLVELHVPRAMFG